MRLPSRIALIALLNIAAFAYPQSEQPSFEVASVRPSQHEGGPDYNNQITYSATEFTGRNLTLRRLVAEAWHCQRNQVIGPPWLDRNEYDIAARLPDGATREQIPLMLRGLLSDRFHLRAHSTSRQTRIYELTVAQGGPRIHPIQPGEATAAGPGLHFQGDMAQFAEYLAAQISIPAPASPSEPAIASGQQVPVLDKTGLQGVYQFNVDVRPELGTDGLTVWRRVLQEQLGLRIENVRADVEFVIVDDAAKIPTPN
jgi:uncharacterized protein (TIGR03435 family)